MKVRERVGTAGPVVEVGAMVLICTVTRYFVGRVIGEDANWIFLADAAWVADTGRYSARALREGIPAQPNAEIEPVPGDGRLDVARGAITDVVRYTHDALR